MHYIDSFPFDRNGIESIKKHHFGSNWPIVYILEGIKEIYIGQTTNAYKRLCDHLKNSDRFTLHSAYLITDELYNMSATHDIESWLIQYISADGKYKLQNKNGGIQNHNYYDKQVYEAKYDNIWADLINFNIVENSLIALENSDLFKYSPYKSLSEEQLMAAEDIEEFLKQPTIQSAIVHGGAGTGKTILATYLIKNLIDRTDSPYKKIALVIPMTALRKTLKRIFRGVKNLSPSMVISPSEACKNKYDLLLIDEAHRLRTRRNITNYQTFDQNNASLGLGNEGTELDWIIQCSKKQIFFFDEHQTIRPTDISKERLYKLNGRHIYLKKQMRMIHSDEFEKYIDSIFNNDDVYNNQTGEYDFMLFNNFTSMRQLLIKKEKEMGLCRLVAGYAWAWKSKKNKNDFDIIIDAEKMRWNSTAHDWVNSPNAIYEVGCIHTIQGYDLNYVGVIIGPELSYDFTHKKFIINKELYFDANGHRGISDPQELEKYILNIYKTMLKRGIRGCYVYCVDENLQRYFESKLHK